MKKLIPILALSLLVVACESRAEKIKRVCSLRFATQPDSQVEINYRKELVKISGATKDFTAQQASHFCSSY